MNFLNMSYNNERELFDILVTEAYNKLGVCMEYYVTSFDSRYDKIWAEDNNRRFIRKFNFMAFYSLPREEKIWTKFGIEGMDTFSIYISKRHFKVASKYDFTRTNPNAYSSHIPKVGDYVIANYNKYIYEITEVKDEIAMYLNSKQHVWELIVKPFKDEHIALTSETSASQISAYTDQDSDKFDIKSTIDEKKPDVLYNPGETEENSQDPFGNW